MEFCVKGEERRERGDFEGIERSVMAMEYGPHRDAYQTFLVPIPCLFTKMASSLPFFCQFAFFLFLFLSTLLLLDYYPLFLFLTC